MSRTKVAVWLFAVTAILSFVAALLPLIRGRPLNVVFLGCGVVFLALAVVRAKQNRSALLPPPDEKL